ncbi:hypothetical protein PSJE_23430 [Pseudomonas jessenii]|nr:hypothetical protein ASD91_26660 [Pseudomonas sp. Root68]KRB69749.1 hypothetical protein ASD95_25795 [Pseudomonas sp. Root71]OOQ44136.1 hypothetical protein AO361_13460 [Pseudomonas fluorescens]OXR30923.1 hypothetical protein PSJE_23430 [Pseudomonas jessenii]QHF40120.1 hypothetical protein PspS34_18400 [Pseudomonas sp. S34]
MNHRQIASYLCIMPPADHRVTTAEVLYDETFRPASRPVIAVRLLDALLMHPTSQQRNLDIRLMDDFERTRLPGALEFLRTL